MQEYDALIIGGGPAGATSAILLAEAGWSVALVERKRYPRRKVCGEYLSPTNWPLLGILGLQAEFGDLAGPPVRHVAVFAGEEQILASLPPAPQGPWQWGRALRREHLDTWLLARAAEVGVKVRQPARCVAIGRKEQNRALTCRVLTEGIRPAAEEELRARVVIAAHGSWDVGPLATQRHDAAAGATNWVAFKAHFLATGLPPGWMPLLAFSDGYGGMVHCDGGRTTLSCCVRRERLMRLGRGRGQSAGEAVGEYLLDACPAVRPVLDGATRDGRWLSAGPIQPGIRPRYRDGVFVVGNAAGEAHPVVAEGISMAMQSAWLLAQQLIPAHGALHRPEIVEQVGRVYAQTWRRSFAPRIRAAAAIAQWASRPRLTAATLPMICCWPGLLTFGAKLSGKVTRTIAWPGQT